MHCCIDSADILPLFAVSVSVRCGHRNMIVKHNFWGSGADYVICNDCGAESWFDAMHLAVGHTRRSVLDLKKK